VPDRPNLEISVADTNERTKVSRMGNTLRFTFQSIAHREDVKVRLVVAGTFSLAGIPVSKHQLLLVDSVIRGIARPVRLQRSRGVNRLGVLSKIIGRVHNDGAMWRNGTADHDSILHWQNESPIYTPRDTFGILYTMCLSSHSYESHFFTHVFVESNEGIKAGRVLHVRLRHTPMTSAHRTQLCFSTLLAGNQRHWRPMPHTGRGRQVSNLFIHFDYPYPNAHVHRPAGSRRNSSRRLLRPCSLLSTPRSSVSRRQWRPATTTQ